MKRGVMLVLGIVFFSSMISAYVTDTFQFTSDFECQDYGIECGQFSINLLDGTNTLKSCGFCSSDKYCYQSKCVNTKEFGELRRTDGLGNDCETLLPFSAFYTPGVTLASRLERYEQTCTHYGCIYNSEIQKCTGTFPSCSYFREQYCKDGDWEPGENVQFGENSYRRSSIDEETGICVTTLKKYNEYEESCTNNLRGVWSETEGSCTIIGTNIDINNPKGYFIPGRALGFGGTVGGGTKIICDYENIKQFQSQFLVYKDSSAPTIRGDGANMFLLSNEELESIQNGNNLSAFIELTNTGIPSGTSVIVSIYAKSKDYDESKSFADNYLPVAQYSKFVDEEGDIVAELPLSKELLLGIDYKGFSSFWVFYDLQGGIRFAPYEGLFYLSTKTGECIETARSCSSFSKAECLEISYFNLGTCSWDYDTNTCNGNNGILCESIGFKETCQILGCQWKANNILERFIDWIKSIFGR